MEIMQAKELVIKAGKELIESGLIARTWGNISCRISETQFVITPSGRAYDTLTPEEIVLVNIEDLEYEGERERIQVFEGTIIARKGAGVSETFTVRRVSYGVGVERVFPVNSPNVAKVETVRRGKVRRSKLYYLRDRVGKAAKVKEQI